MFAIIPCCIVFLSSPYYNDVVVYPLSPLCYVSVALGLLRVFLFVTNILQVRVTGAPTDALARKLGKAVVNSPLFKSAIAGNDPNVGRLLAVVGRVMGVESPHTDTSNTR